MWLTISQPPPPSPRCQKWFLWVRVVVVTLLSARSQPCCGPAVPSRSMYIVMCRGAVVLSCRCMCVWWSMVGERWGQVGVRWGGEGDGLRGRGDLHGWVEGMVGLEDGWWGREMGFMRDGARCGRCRGLGRDRTAGPQTPRQDAGRHHRGGPHSTTLVSRNMIQRVWLLEDMCGVRHGWDGWGMWGAVGR